MDFARVLEMVGGHCERQGIRYALCGGLAMAAYGLGRLTFDLDLAADAGGQDSLIAFLERQGYETLYRSRGFSNHRHPDDALGCVDMVWIGGATADTVFSAVRSVPGRGGRNWPVVCPEHLAAMKVHAVHQDPTRIQDLGDIRFLLGLPGVDLEAIRVQFVRRHMEERFDELVASL
ncbi:MAG TPA: hypothetical protein P5234_09330 [Thermoanaerobaculaceae bacterium]|mgnify:CR=1 FL=1|nr:hypothetical protein [Thermoanaerobaculaceae bacterium]HRS16433.1 hypothetical protein [Thermoanaerobaculaceae bacterium]